MQVEASPPSNVIAEIGRRAAGPPMRAKLAKAAS
jgi:hypothetical protein